MSLSVKGMLQPYHHRLVFFFVLCVGSDSSDFKPLLSADERRSAFFGGHFSAPCIYRHSWLPGTATWREQQQFSLVVLTPHCFSRVL